MKTEHRAVHKALYAHCTEHDHAFVLDSCGLTPAHGAQNYQILAAFGCKHLIKHETWTGAFELMQEMAQPGRWYFGILAYDLKNELEVLESKGTKLNGIPYLLMIEPEWVAGIHTDGTFFCEGISEKDALKFLDLPIHKHPINPLKFSPPEDFAHYKSTIKHIQKEISEGNVYEMNYCMQLEAELPAAFDSLGYHLQRIDKNPAPFAAYVQHEQLRLLCSSPERYLSHRQGQLVSQPIKGTMPRSKDQTTDQLNREHLKNDEKFRAENVMIVDLVRNDLARVAKTGSIQVTELFGVYPYTHVHHLVSTIEAELKEGLNFVDAIKASFPMGSMTGAPKIAAMHMIDQLEAHQRQWYSGSVFYIDPKGNADANVIIRSIVANLSENKAWYGVGGAITIDSDAAQEYEECAMKIRGISNQ